MMEHTVNKIIAELTLFLTEDVPSRRFDDGMRRLEVIWKQVGLLEQQFVYAKDEGWFK